MGFVVRLTSILGWFTFDTAAKTSAKDSNGKTALDHAVKRNLHRIESVLRRYS